MYCRLPNVSMFHICGYNPKQNSKSTLNWGHRKGGGGIWDSALVYCWKAINDTQVEMYVICGIPDVSLLPNICTR